MELVIILLLVGVVIGLVSLVEKVLDDDEV